MCVSRNVNSISMRFGSHMLCTLIVHSVHDHHLAEAYPTTINFHAELNFIQFNKPNQFIDPVCMVSIGLRHFFSQNIRKYQHFQSTRGDSTPNRSG